MSFADDRVVDLVNSKFVAAWFNHNPGGRSGGAEVPQPAWKPEELELYPEGGGGDNAVVYVAGPDGKILHVIRGWFRPERLVEELKFALSLKIEGAVSAHAARAKEVRAEQERLAAANPAEMAKPHVQSAIRRQHAMLGLLSQVHVDVVPLIGVPLKERLEAVRSASYGREFS